MSRTVVVLTVLCFPVMAGGPAPLPNGPLAGPGMKAKGEGTVESLRLAIEDLLLTHGEDYPKGAEFLARLEEMKDERAAGFAELKREALLANPLLDFDRLLMVRRRGHDGLPANWQGNSSLGRAKKGKNAPAFDNELVVMSPLFDGEVETVVKPPAGRFLGDFDLDFSATRILYSSHTDEGNWGVFEIGIDPATGRMKPGSSPRLATPDMGRDVDSYDPVYLPSGKIIFVCSSGYEGVPCVGGKDYVGNLHVMNADGTGVRRLCFEQDNDWNPVVTETGRVMYTRWEYTDSAHYFSRVLMTMNPDGTDQRSLYGSNSYWPNSLFYCRPIPGKPSMFAGIVSGHHGTRRAGALGLFDVLRGTHEADGAVQLMMGRGKKVEPLVIDRLAGSYAPHFLHPYPLSDKYFLASSGGAICLVDVFDNLLRLKSLKGEMLIEPVPLRETTKPPVIPDRVRLGEKEATVLISDVYDGPGLQGVPRGTVKRMRVYRYEYSPRDKGGHYSMGMETTWDARVLLGTAPVEEDGSASFRIPANTPVSLQPLDADGRALQLMRSWMVGMPGERVSCIGCHESHNTAPSLNPSIAHLKQPASLTPWHGPARGFSFEREVQPVLDRYCVSCHDGSAPGASDGPAPHPLRRAGTGPKTGKLFAQAGIPDLSTAKAAHANLHPYVRRNGPEGDYHLLTPLEFHANTSELVQMLEKGHQDVRLDAEAWDRIHTWIDLNAPYHGTWTEAGAKPETLARRLELRRTWANDDFNPERIVNPYRKSGEVVRPVAVERPKSRLKLPRWPFDAAVATRAQGKDHEIEVDLGDGVVLPVVRVPRGRFPMGSDDESPAEYPVSEVVVDKQFWMGATEVTLRQFRQFDPDYTNGAYDMHYKDQVKRGYYMDDLDFPVVRVSWDQAVEFCYWLSGKLGRKVSLPSEAQWEWACRAGSADAFSFGGLDSDLSGRANLADRSISELAVSGVNPRPIKNPNHVVDFELKDPRFDDGALHLAKVGSYPANAWGLHDMHGNAAEWTRSAYKPYPYRADDGRNDPAGETKVVRGGSWHDRPFRATSSFRLGFPRWQRVYHTGFRVVVE